jgi:hypothetical protein
MTIQKLIGKLSVERSRTYRILVIGTWDMDNPLTNEEAQQADVILKPNGDGSYRIVRTRKGNQETDIPAEIMNNLFGM